MSDFQNNRPPLPPRKKHYLDDHKLRLTAEKKDGMTGRPSLSTTIINGNPRMDVYTNVPNDKDKGLIRAAMDTPTFYVLLECVEKVIAAEPKTRYVIENKKPSQNRGEQPQVVSKTVIGKDEEGRVYLSLLSIEQDRPKIRFPFGLSYFHTLIRPDGQKMSEAEISVVAAGAWVRMMRNLAANVLTDNYVEPPPRDNKGGGGNWKSGGGGGGGNWKDRQQNRSGGGGNWQNRQEQKSGDDWSGDGGGGAKGSTDFDDELPM